jgi:hypothetical protein
MASVTAPSPSPAPPAAIRVAVALSWSLPLAALIALGLSDRIEWLVPVGRLSPYTTAKIASAIAAVGLVAGLAAVRARGELERGAVRRAIAGTAASGAMVVVVIVATASGAASGRQTQIELERASKAALSDAPGWNGGADIDGANVFAFEIDPSTELAEILRRPYDTPYRVVLFGVDNRAGVREVVADFSGARLGHASGAVTSAVLPVEAVHVSAGERFEGAPAFFAPDESWRDVRWIEIHVDDAVRRLQGRYFTLEEKRAIDAARGRRP